MQGKPRSNPKPKAKSTERDERYKAYRNYIRSKKFKEVKHIVEERDGYQCQVCGRTRDDGITLSCHHRVYKHLFEGGEVEAADCITLCSICHRAVHSARKNYQWFSMDNKRNKNEKDEE